MVVVWPLSLHHEDRCKSITEKMTQSPVIAELLNELQNHSNSFLCERNKPLFHNILVSGYFVC